MATEGPINGNYAPHQGYGGLEHQQNTYGHAAHSSTPAQPPPTSSTPVAPSSSSSAPQPDISKDEVGWYFVEQYYTTLSRNPDKLYLFYQKRSQFVSGQETDKVDVCVGQRAIHERIKELDFKECKVRVTNVDSQSSDSNIVIQVIGEISNRSQPHRKFVQTFVLATQPTGYFVLNDIFRYLIDEEEEPEQAVESRNEEAQQVPAADSGFQEPAPTAAEVEPKGLTGSTDPAAVENDAQRVDQEIDSRISADQHVETPADKVNGVSEAAKDVQPAEDAPAAVLEEEPAAPETSVPTVEEPEPEPEPEKAVAEPAAAPTPPKQETAQPAPAPKPAAPATWASLAARANKVATPSAPSPASSNTSQSKPAPKPTTPAAAPSAPTSAQASSAAPAAPAAQRDASPAEGSDEWTAVGSSHNRNQSRQVNNQPEGPQFRGYIGNVRDNIDGNELRSLLSKFGEILYFDIARQKNCAFIDFRTAEGFQAAKDASPHIINGEELIVEDRKFKPGATPYVPRGQYQGGRGRGGAPGGPRGNYQNQRGGYASRARGGPGGTPRGRGSSIAT